MAEKVSVAIALSADAYDGQHPALAGRHSAGASFLEAYVRYGSFDTLLAATPQPQLFEQLQKAVDAQTYRRISVQQIDHFGVREGEMRKSGAPFSLRDAGVLYRPDPLINRFSWLRSSSYSHALCGITFTLSDRIVLEGLFELLMSPVAAHDALICISNSGKQVVQQVFQQAKQYLQERFGATQIIEPMLPVIPLGIHPDRFPSGSTREKLRNEYREKLKCTSDEIVLLFVGRLNTLTKANPLPLQLAIGQCAKRNPGKKLRLVYAGWFEKEGEEKILLEAATLCTPGVPVVVVRRPSAQALSGIYAAGDIFVSLSDNVQETFGLTLLEAMASGLPVVASNWDGYRETVRHGQDGFLVPTCLPPQGVGADFVDQYLQQKLSHAGFVGHTSMSSSVDVPAATNYLHELVSSPDLRRTMGAAGRKRVETEYSWKHIIARYEELWKEQRSRLNARASPEKIYKGTVRVPEPFTLFSHYSSKKLAESDVLKVGQGEALLLSLEQTPYARVGVEFRLTLKEMQQLVSKLGNNGLPVASIKALFPTCAPDRILRTLMYLLKFDVVRLG